MTTISMNPSTPAYSAARSAEASQPKTNCTLSSGAVADMFAADSYEGVAAKGNPVVPVVVEGIKTLLIKEATKVVEKKLNKVTNNRTKNLFNPFKWRL